MRSASSAPPGGVIVDVAPVRRSRRFDERRDSGDFTTSVKEN